MNTNQTASQSELKTLQQSGSLAREIAALEIELKDNRCMNITKPESNRTKDEL